jgi:hypothetical protein
VAFTSSTAGLFLHAATAWPLLAHAFHLPICRRHTQTDQITVYMTTTMQDETTGTQAAYNALEHYT